MSAVDPIKVEGLREFVRDIKKLDSELPKVLRVALNEAADVVVREARPRVPRRSGRAAASLKAKSTRTQVRVSAGGNRVPYYPWLEFGGRVGRKRGIKRPFLKGGRYLFDAYADVQPRFAEVLERSLIDVARETGIEMD